MILDNTGLRRFRGRLGYEALAGLVRALYGVPFTMYSLPQVMAYFGCQSTKVSGIAYK
jgi:hypothetical protein